jgi:uncharacterized protein
VDLSGRVAVVTGASRGIGAATAQLLARRGARVALLARGAEALAHVEGTIRAAGGEARAFVVDATDAAAMASTADAVRGAFGAPDVLVNNAGTGAFRFLDETAPGDIVAMMAAPYFAAAYATRACLPGMVHQRRGHIVNVTSVAALRAIPGATAYNAACFAMRGFTDALRMDVHGLGIGVTLLAAGTSTTPGYEHYPGVEERMPGVVRIVPLLTPDKIAAAIVRAIERERRLVIIPGMLRWMLALDRVAPWLVEQLVVRSGWTRARHPS